MYSMYGKICILLLIFVTGGCVSQSYTEEDARHDALEFITNAPTFSFDGIKKTLTIASIEPTDCQGCYTVTVQFTCRNTGYGKRASLFVVNRPTEHVALIHIEQGEITRAIIDNQWDELNQKSITG